MNTKPTGFSNEHVTQLLQKIMCKILTIETIASGNDWENASPIIPAVVKTDKQKNKNNSLSKQSLYWTIKKCCRKTVSF